VGRRRDPPHTTTYYPDPPRPVQRLAPEAIRPEEAIRAAWAKDTQPLGENMLTNSNFSEWQAGQGIPSSWNLEQHEGCQAVLSKGQTAQMRVRIGRADATDWHLQFNQRGLALKQGRYYTVSFEAASDQPRQIACTVGQAHDPWNNIGLSRPLSLTAEPKRFSLGFVATADESNARVSLPSAAVRLRSLYPHRTPRRRPGRLGERRIPESKSIALFQENESEQRILDRMMFLAEIEKAYFDGMRSYVRRTLAATPWSLGRWSSDSGPVCPERHGLHRRPRLLAAPRFPNKSWDAADWFVEQKPMTDTQRGHVVQTRRGEARGQTYTVSEYTTRLRWTRRRSASR